MNQITGITSQPKQHFSVQLDDGSQVAFVLEYRPQQLAWVADITWGTWVLNGLRLVSSPNLLRPYFGEISFGLMILSEDNVDPLNLVDFEHGTSAVYLLNTADVATVEVTAYSGF